MAKFVPTEEEEALGSRIRMLWCIERRYFDLRHEGVPENWGAHHMPSWDGGLGANGKHHENIWPRIASFCLENKLQPTTLVKAMFHNAQKRRPPTPNAACGPKALQRYKEYDAPAVGISLEADHKHRLEAQKQCVAASVFRLQKYSEKDEKSAWRQAITNPTDPLTPLFRYCVARNQGWEDIAEMYQGQAEYQYDFSPEVYNAVWGDWLPDDLRKRKGNGK